MLTSKVAGSTATLAAAAAAATGATDAAAQGRPPQASTWNGFYVGGSIGGSWLNSSPNGSSASFIQRGTSRYGKSSVGEAVGDSHASNVIGGLLAGFNWQNGKSVFGVEADFSWLGNSKAQSTGSVNTATFSVGPYGYSGRGITFRESQIDAVATFRGRFGYDFNGTMPYITVGLALGQIKSTWGFTGVGHVNGSSYSSAASAAKTSWEPGLVVGGGVEQKLVGNWSVRADVQWMKFSTQMITNPLRANTYAVTGTGGAINFENSLTIAKLGINYRF